MLRLTPSLTPLRLLLISGCVLGGLNVNAQLTGDTFAEAKAKGAANVVFSYVETPGFAAKEGAKVTGFCVDLMNEFSIWLQKEEGIELKFVLEERDSKDFTRFMNGMKLASGGVFGLGTFSITQERKQHYTFSPPFITNVAVLMTHKNVPNLQSLETMSTGFKGMTMVTVKGSQNEKHLLRIKAKHFPQVPIKYVDSFSDVLNELATNEKAFTELDFTFYLTALKDKMPLKRHPAGDEASEDIGIIMPKNSDWSPVMARFFSEFKGGTTYRKLISDHLGPHALKLLDAVASK